MSLLLQHYNHFTPLEASMVFHFASRGGGQNSRLVQDDFRALLDEKVHLFGLTRHVSVRKS